MRLPEPSPVFASFWRFAAERHAILERRMAGDPSPWTDDPILASFRFTNAFRAADRVSQHLIRDVIYGCETTADDTVLRVLLFKLFNRVETWELLERELGPVTTSSFDPDRAAGLLAAARSRGRAIYSNAYIVPPVPGSSGAKHAGHLRLIVDLVDGGLADRCRDTSNLRELFELLRAVPGFGDFLAFQHAIDLCYSEVVDHDEDEFVVAGPGALDGLSKMFPGLDLRRSAEVIRSLTDDQELWFAHFDLAAPRLLGRRLHLVDVQNLCCEISKYARVAHPDVSGVAGRVRIKQTFAPAGALGEIHLPPKWRQGNHAMGSTWPMRSYS